MTVNTDTKDTGLLLINIDIINALINYHDVFTYKYVNVLNIFSRFYF